MESGGSIRGSRLPNLTRTVAEQRRQPATYYPGAVGRPVAGEEPPAGSLTAPAWLIAPLAVAAAPIVGLFPSHGVLLKRG